MWLTIIEREPNGSDGNEKVWQGIILNKWVS
jgi:hypothetical protein